MFSAILLIIIGFWIYIETPYTYKEYKSPFGNAKITIRLDSKPIFFAYNNEPENGNYLIFYNDKVIGKLLRSECCYTNTIEDINWYKDSVTFKYIDNTEKPVVNFKSYDFQQFSK